MTRRPAYLVKRALLVVVVLIGASVLVRHAMQGHNFAAHAAPQQAALYCEFYDMTHSTTVVSFNFAVHAPAGPAPRYQLTGQAESDGPKAVDQSANDPKLVWSYAVDDGTPAISSPDGGPAIELYGLRPGAPGQLWIEAGIRGGGYKNLEGKCLQRDFAPQPAPSTPGRKG